MSLFYKLYTYSFKFVIQNQVSLRYARSSVKKINNKNAIIKNLLRRNRKSCKVRTSVSASNPCASVTVEAALALTVFMAVMLSLISAAGAVTTYQKVQQAAVNAGNEAAAYGDALAGISGVYMLFRREMKSIPTQQEGIVGGMSGVSLFGSYADKEAGVIKMIISYRLKPPLMVIPGLSLKMRHCLYFTVWNGYHRGKTESGDSNCVQTYFIAENESVYHCSAQCSHLRLSISAVKKQDVADMRNSNGQRYTACSKCRDAHQCEMVYITTDGTKYHTSLSCSGLKRTIYQVHDTGQLKSCERCGGND